MTAFTENITSDRSVYLSASQRLSRYFDGERLRHDIAKQYSQSMTNMWPYLRFREAETRRRRELYDKYFIARYYRKRGLPNPISSYLWGSPNNERQITIAMRWADYMRGGGLYGLLTFILPGLQ